MQYSKLCKPAEHQLSRRRVLGAMAGAAGGLGLGGLGGLVQPHGLRPEITPGSALLRELHVYGNAVKIGESGVVQHRGIGRKLMAKAEEIAKENGFTKMVVIAGVGVKGYYCDKLGYSREGLYVVKAL